MKEEPSSYKWFFSLESLWSPRWKGEAENCQIAQRTERMLQIEAFRKEKGEKWREERSSICKVSRKQLKGVIPQRQKERRSWDTSEWRSKCQQTGREDQQVRGGNGKGIYRERGECISNRWKKGGNRVRRCENPDKGNNNNSGREPRSSQVN